MTEVQHRLTADEARALTDEINADATLLGQKLLRAYHGEAWVALGYESWRSYAVNEFDEEAA